MKAIPITATVLLAIHWALWPGDLIGSAFGSILFLVTAILIARGMRDIARVTLMAGVVTAAFLDASFTDWQPWVAIPLVLAGLDAPAKAGKDGTYQGILYMMVSFLAMCLFLVLWRPTRFGLIAPDATLAGVTFLAALGAGFALYALRQPNME